MRFVTCDDYLYTFYLVPSPYRRNFMDSVALHCLVPDCQKSRRGVVPDFLAMDETMSLVEDVEAAFVLRQQQIVSLDPYQQEVEVTGLERGRTSFDTAHQTL